MNSIKQFFNSPTLILILLGPILFSQAIPEINYQAAIRDANGNLQANTAIDLRFTIYSGTNATNQEYEETHLNKNTSAQGIVNLQIGNGDTKNGNLANVSWHEDIHHLQVEIDFGNGFVNLGTDPLVSVPYALAAQKVADMSLSEVNELKGLAPGVDQILKFNGASWVLSTDDNTDSQTLSVNGSNLSISKGNSITLPITSYTAGNGIQITGTSISNSAPDQTVTLSGSGATTISGTYPSFTVSSTDSFVVYNGGNGISVSGTTIVNTAPDQIVSLTGTGATTVSGTYPNFTISSTDNNTTYSAGTGISMNGTVISNSSPDQMVSVTGSGATVVSGSYPNFTISSTDQNTIYRAGAGMNLTATTFEADSSAPIWNANQLQNNDVSNANPLDSNVLRYNASTGQWQPSNIAESPWLKVSSGIEYPGLDASILGQNGNRNVWLTYLNGNTNNGWIGVMNDQGSYRSNMTVITSGAGYMSTLGTNGNDNTSISHLFGNSNSGWISTCDSLGQDRVLMTILSGGTGYFETRGANGNDNLRISSLINRPNHGWLGTCDSSGIDRTRMTVLSSGEGYISTLGSNGWANVQLTSLLGYPDHGYVSVEDASGISQAGIYVDANGDGIVFGDQKNFRVEHPKDESKEIWYGSLEGPEMGAYHRGTATLVNGEVSVKLPEYYTLMANTSTMTVILTPLDASSKGLAVIEKTAEGFTVKELYNGKGQYSFDWEVKAKRIGLEDFQVVREVQVLSNKKASSAEDSGEIKKSVQELAPPVSK